MAIGERGNREARQVGSAPTGMHGERDKGCDFENKHEGMRIRDSDEGWV